MEEAAALVAERRAQEAADAEKARVARFEKARKMAAAEEAEGLRIIYADFANAMRVGDFGKIYTFIDRFRLDINWEDTYGNTPLIAACRYGLRVPIMKLCRRGAEPNRSSGVEVASRIRSRLSASQPAMSSAARAASQLS